jgi:hypothetical protein
VPSAAGCVRGKEIACSKRKQAKAWKDAESFVGIPFLF